MEPSQAPGHSSLGTRADFSTSPKLLTSIDGVPISLYALNDFAYTSIFSPMRDSKILFTSVHLIGGFSIFQSGRHNLIAVQPSVSYEGCLFLTLLTERDPMIPQKGIHKIQHCMPYRGIYQLVNFCRG